MPNQNRLSLSKKAVVVGAAAAVLFNPFATAKANAGSVPEPIKKIGMFIPNLLSDGVDSIREIRKTVDELPGPVEPIKFPGLPQADPNAEVSGTAGKLSELAKDGVFVADLFCPVVAGLDKGREAAFIFGGDIVRGIKNNDLGPRLGKRSYTLLKNGAMLPIKAGKTVLSFAGKTAKNLLAIPLSFVPESAMPAPGTTDGYGIVEPTKPGSKTGHSTFPKCER